MCSKELSGALGHVGGVTGGSRCSLEAGKSWVRAANVLHRERCSAEGLEEMVGDLPGIVGSYLCRHSFNVKMFNYEIFHTQKIIKQTPRHH